MRNSPSTSWGPVFGLVVFVALAVYGLVMLVRVIPERRGPEPTPVPIVETKTSAEQTSCVKAGGKWMECGNPCHGKEGACVAVCEPQCLCGGTGEWTCPKSLTCQDYEPASGGPTAIGVCRTPVAVVPTSTTPVPSTPTTTSTPVARPIPAGMICDDSHSICVRQEDFNAKAANPIVVRGSGIAFESTISWQLLNANGQVVQNGFVMADAPDVGKPGDFEIKASMQDVPTSASGTMRVFESSAKDGSPIHVVNVPVQLETKSMTVSFFYTDEAAVVTGSCEKVEKAVTIIPWSAKPIEATLRTYLVYQTTQTRVNPLGDWLKTVVLSNGTLTLTMKAGYSAQVGGGSCKVQAARAELEAVAKQFPSVKSVVIQEEGRTAAETLQP